MKRRAGIRKVWVFWGLACLTLLLIISCQKSEMTDLKERLDNFRMILPEDLRGEFDQKNYSYVAFGIDSLLKIDSDFKTKYEKLKDDEAINVFTPEEVVSFFDEYFVRKIKRGN